MYKLRWRLSDMCVCVMCVKGAAHKSSSQAPKNESNSTNLPSCKLAFFPRRKRENRLKMARSKTEKNARFFD